MIKIKDKVYEMSFKEAVIYHVSFIYHPFNLDVFAMDKMEKSSIGFLKTRNLRNRGWQVLHIETL